MSKLMDEALAELRRVEKERILADQERRRSNAAGKHTTPKHPARGARRTAIIQEQENG